MTRLDRAFATTRPGRAGAGALAALAAAILLAGCSGVPTSSSPEAIGPVAGGVAPSAASVITPPAGADERQIVLGFLDVNVSEDAHHTSARGFLTADASKKWVDTSASVVTNILTGVPNLTTHTVTVTADKVGTVDAHGIYTPVTEGSGSTPISLTFGMSQPSGQWRINTLANGLIIDQNAFLQSYKPHPIYFFDQSQRRLLPDLRYSPLTDQTLCNWLLDQLAAGPRAELQSAYTTDLPEQTAHAAVVFGPTTIAVDLPGAAQLDGPTRSRLAVQLAYTFSLDFSEPPVTLSDAAKPVSIPQVTQPFQASNFLSFSPSIPGNVYYLHDGDAVNDSGVKLGGQAGSDGGLTSIAVAQRGSSNFLAATKGKAGAAQLLVGPVGGSLAAVALTPGSLTRPAWAPGLSEVWVGDGATLLRVPALGAAAVAVQLSSSSGAVTGTIRSVAFSPDGVRVALIIKAVDASSQMWIGTVVRTAGGASVESLEPITPVGLTLTDVAWNDLNTLYTIGADPTRVGGYGIWSVQVDGSLLTPRSTSGLPSAPDSITTSQAGLPWVSANNTVWEQHGSETSWTAPGANAGTTLGTAPNYQQ
jgi:hypothetical protein